MKISLHYKWTGIVCLIILLISLASYFTSVGRGSLEIRNALVCRGQTIVRGLAANSEYGLFVRDVRDLEQRLDSVNHNPDVDSCAIYDRSGLIIAGNAADRLMPEAMAAFAGGAETYIGHPADGSKADVMVIVPVLTVGKDTAGMEAELFSSDSDSRPEGARTLGYAALRMSGKGSLERISMLRRNLAVVTVLVSLLCGIVVAVLVHRMVLPLRRLAFAARRIAGGELTQKVEVSRNDEIGDLAAAFNTMTARLESTTVSRDLLVEEIEQRKKTEEERLRLEKDLLHSRKLEAVGTLAAGIAHEINTPVQFISDNTQFLHDAMADLFVLVESYKARSVNCAETCAHRDPELEKRIKALESKIDMDFIKKEVTAAIDQTKEGLSRVSRIVLAMKDFSHVDAEQNFQEADLNKAIDSTIVVCRNAWKYVAELKTDFDVRLPPVNCVLSDINQVVMNLVVNAAHAIEEKLAARNPDVAAASGGGKGLITVSTRYSGDLVRISVSDTGAGIPEAVREKIFDPFFTTKKVGKGTGQGLSMAYSIIVEKHGGKIDVDSQVGRGTVFTLVLPINGAAAMSGE